jgi:hypothetical protein
VRTDLLIRLKSTLAEFVARSFQRALSSCGIVASIAPKMDQTSYLYINIKSKRNLSEDISLHTDTGNFLRLEFLSRLPAMEEWHKFRVSDVTSQDVENVLQQLRKMPDIDEANLDKPKMKIKR